MSRKDALRLAGGAVGLVVIIVAVLSDPGWMPLWVKLPLCFVSAMLIGEAPPPRTWLPWLRRRDGGE
ncbi:hypothetical protein [Demequina mangrovi]|uniref:Uncharacterized protein n=1 Tax=Demequina mangrovi TaxID=1043493 RepID=A0A1H6WKA5_9MICO|nr:hypothetical protein [Demequina mangrovi]SEJ12785.1 hypothetical protein SAMN05421637_0874 [Demequina mangrovi]